MHWKLYFILHGLELWTFLENKLSFLCKENYKIFLYYFVFLTKYRGIGGRSGSGNKRNQYRCNNQKLQKSLTTTGDAAWTERDRGVCGWCMRESCTWSGRIAEPCPLCRGLTVSADWRSSSRKNRQERSVVGRNGAVKRDSVTLPGEIYEIKK